MIKTNEVYFILDILLPNLKIGNVDIIYKEMKEKEIKADIENNIISDYAALWLNDDLLVDFFIKMKALGGSQTEHKSIFQNCISCNKKKGFDFLIKSNILEKQKDSIVYFINEVVRLEMNDDKIKMQKYFLNVLRGKIDVLSFKLNFEHTPSVLKRIVESKSEDMFKYICKLGWMDNCWTNREIYESLFFKSKESKDFVDCFMTKMIKYLDLNKLDKDKYITLIEQNSLDNFVKTLNFDVLNKKMEHINMQNKSSKKIKL